MGEWDSWLGQSLLSGMCPFSDSLSEKSSRDGAAGISSFLSKQKPETEKREEQVSDRITCSKIKWMTTQM